MSEVSDGKTKRPTEISRVPRGVRLYAQVVDGEVHCSLPAFARDRILAIHSRIVHKVDEDRAGLAAAATNLR